MKGDFSRIRFIPSRHYTSVLQQQGRVSLDSDANEQRAIDEYIRGTENLDVIGKYGAPRHNAGFEVTLGNRGLQFGPGRYYVNGILCDNEALLDYDSQPYLLNGPSQAQLFRDLRAGKFSAVQVYLEVWQRLVTALDDSCLREPALGQADTTARLQTVWRVVAEGVNTTSTFNGKPTLDGAVLRDVASVTKAATIGKFVAGGSATGASVSSSSSTAGRKTAGVSTAGSSFAGTSFVPEPVASNVAQELSKCCVQMYSNITERTNFGKMAAQTSGQTDDCSCQPTPAAGYRGLENQLYRVEVHQGGDETTSTFKWSRENASVVSAITTVSGSDVVVDSLGPDANLGFQAGEWVEISDDTFLFGFPPNQPGDLYQIKKTTPEQLTLTMYQTVAAVDKNRNARLRRWEQSVGASASGVPLSSGTWVDLENGIQIQFAPGQYESGDYWLIPARTASGQIEWPPCGSDGSEFQAPKFTHVYRAPLACIHTNNRRQLTIDDCRLFFLPLTELGAAQTPPALHINSINWPNDDFLTLDNLLLNGLKVSLDAAFSGIVQSSTFIVSLEVPIAGTTSFQRGGFATGGFATAGFASVGLGKNDVMLRSPVIIDGLLTIQGSDLLWQLPTQGNYSWFLVDEIVSPGASVGAWARVRVKLLGRDIFNGTAANRVFLDGQSFGTRAFRQDGTTARVDLQLPSGDSEKASDFESWFYLLPVLTIPTFTVVPPAVKLIFNQAGGGFTVANVNDNGNPPIPVTPTGTVTLNYPVVSDTVVSLSVGGTGVAGIISVPTTVTVPAGQSSVQFPVTVISNPGEGTQNYQIFASVTLAGTATSSNSAPFSVTGFNIIFIRRNFNLDQVSLVQDALNKVSPAINQATTATDAVAARTERAQAAVTEKAAATQPDAVAKKANPTLQATAKEAPSATQSATAQDGAAATQPAVVAEKAAASQAQTVKQTPSATQAAVVSGPVASTQVAKAAKQAKATVQEEAATSNVATVTEKAASTKPATEKVATAPLAAEKEATTATGPSTNAAKTAATKAVKTSPAASRVKNKGQG